MARGRWAVLAVITAAQFLVVIDGLILSVALPSIQKDLRFSDADLQWVVNAFVLAFGGFLLLGGRIGDIVGRRRVLIGGLSIFAAASIVGALAPSAAVLIGARAGQGLGSALCVSSALAVLSATFAEGPDRNRALGIQAVIEGPATAAGPLIGGLVTHALGWEWILFGNVLVAGALMLSAILLVPESHDVSAPSGFDLPGALCVAVGLSALVFGITQIEGAGFVAGRAIAPVVAGSALLGAFVMIERRSSSPLVPPEIFHSVQMRGANITAATITAGYGAVLFIGTLYLQRILKFDAFETGMAFLPLSICTVLTGPLVSRCVDRLGPRPVAAAGALLQAAGLVTLARLPVSGAYLTDVLPGFVLVGVGAVAAYIPITVAAMARVGTSSGVASGIFNTAQHVGNAITLALLATSAAARTGAAAAEGAARSVSLTAGYRVAFLVSAGVLSAGAVLALLLLERREARSSLRSSSEANSPTAR
jgi:EmrB/QacA subfamily drug resistance transporter